MATGDAIDVTARLRSELPPGWFPDNAPILTQLLAGFAVGFARIFSLLSYVKAQSRFNTAVGPWLDATATDYFGTALARQSNELDPALAKRIGMEVLRPRATRQAVIQALTDLTGRTPTVFEPANASDTGGYGYQGMTAGTGLAYGGPGGYGSVSLPFQAFVTVYRPLARLTLSLPGYGSGAGGYGVAMAYGNATLLLGSGVSDAQIYARVASVAPAATIVWTAILS